ncbi:PadR family transcriptional regulator [Methanosphaera cuniculi]|uniref:PadR family transcriptional regulator n=1 Tax=Methanosphaera cuniculi TaxID=1077256 RepID=UPI0026EFDFFB|nr:PadR family transcriptional regulator [Methanosphaera cuniculi]
MNEKQEDLSFMSKKFLYSLMSGVRKIFILWLISQGKTHGYAIIAEINEQFKDIHDGKKVHGSTIYPILHNLEDEGLIKSEKELNGKKEIKAYEITQKGKDFLNSLKKFIRNKEVPDLTLLFIKDMFIDDNDKIIKFGGE